MPQSVLAGPSNSSMELLLFRSRMTPFSFFTVAHGINSEMSQFHQALARMRCVFLVESKLCVYSASNLLHIGLTEHINNTPTLVVNHLLTVIWS